MRTIDSPFCHRFGFALPSSLGESEFTGEISLADREFHEDALFGKIVSLAALWRVSDVVRNGYASTTCPTITLHIRERGQVSLHGRKQYLYFRTNAQLCGFVLACRYPRPTLRIKNLRRQKIAFHSGKPYRPQERHCEMFVVLVVLNDWESQCIHQS